MRIATITNWAYGITVGLTLASGSAMLMASSADRVERQAVQQRQVFDTLSDEVENDAWALSDLARLYVVKPSPETLEQYQQLQRSDKSIELRLARLKDNGASREELALLHDGLQIAAELQDEQQAALAHVANGDAPAAIAILYGKAYETELERMQTQIDRFRHQLKVGPGRGVTGGNVLKGQQPDGFALGDKRYAERLAGVRLWQMIAGDIGFALHRRMAESPTYRPAVVG